MLKYIHNKITATRDQTKISNCLTKGMLASSSRVLDINDPRSWEFSGFSQNGEDGVIDYLLTKLPCRTKFLVELGCGDGLENCSTWSAIVLKYHGIVVDANADLIDRYRLLIGPYSRTIRSIACHVSPENVVSIVSQATTGPIDLLSLDIDSYDYEVMSEILQAGFRPAIVVVEYNSAFGEVADAFIPFDKYYSLRRLCDTRSERLLYGVSFQGWIALFGRYAYKLVHVDSAGVNMFFIDEGRFSKAFHENLRSPVFQENLHQLQSTGLTHNEQKRLLFEVLTAANHK